MIRPLIFLFCVAAANLLAKDPAVDHPSAPFASAMPAAAGAYLESLHDEQLRERAVFPFDDEERFNWHYVPRNRRGLSLKDLNEEQREAAFALLRSALSPAGFQKTKDIILLEGILGELTNSPGFRDPELYFLTLFGDPSTDKAWGWRFEGHHLSLNFSSITGQLTAVTPAFFGANPATVPRGPHKGLRVLADEEDVARELVRALTPAQQKIAIFSATAPREIITGADREVMLKERTGIRHADLTPEQQQQLWRLILVYSGKLQPEPAAEQLERIRSRGLDEIYFTWAGGLEPGEGHYYRIHGPSFLIEYDNTQNNANHVHSVWRDLENDFGRDYLREHYQQGHKH